MSFDLALCISADALNLAAGQLYELVHQRLLVGSREVPIPDLGTGFELRWDIAAPPVVALPSPSDGGAEVTATLPLVDVGVVPDGLPEVTFRVVAGLDAEAQIDDGGLVTTTPRQVSVESADLGQPLQSLLDGFLLPRALEVFGPAIPRFQLPPVHVQSLNVSPPKVVTQGQRLVAVAALTASGPTTTPPAATVWPDHDLFVLLSAAALQAGAEAAIAAISGDLHDAGRATAAGFGFDWHYDVSLSRVQVELQGPLITLGLHVAGSAGAGVVLFGQPVDVTFDVRVVPDPTAKLSVAIDTDNGVVVTVESVGTVVAVVEPVSVGAGVVEALTGGMISVIAAAVSAGVTTFLRNLRFEVARVPDLPVTIAGVQALARPRELNISNFAEFLSITGLVDITHP